MITLHDIAIGLLAKRTSTGWVACCPAHEDHTPSLTLREREVMRQVISGLLNKQVAAELNITEFTVKIHRGHVMRKMHADSLADLVRMAESLGISLPKR